MLEYRHIDTRYIKKLCIATTVSIIVKKFNISTKLFHGLYAAKHLFKKTKKTLRY